MDPKDLPDLPEELPLEHPKELLPHPFPQPSQADLELLEPVVDANSEPTTPVLLDLQDLRVFLVSPDMMVFPVLMELLVSMLKTSLPNLTLLDASPALLDLKVLLDLLESLVPVVWLDLRVKMECTEETDTPELPENPDLLDLPDPLDCLDLKEKRQVYLFQRCF